jgi:Ca-activated chloride channel family protein
VSLHWLHPEVLLLLLLLPLLALRPRGGTPAVRFAGASAAPAAGRRARWLARLPPLLRGLALALLVGALARPRTGAAATEERGEGIAIMIAFDVSSSMLAEDFQPRNRLEVAKATTLDFVAGRRQDRIGLVAFAGEALTQVPATTDYPILAAAIRNLNPGTLEDGTAIGTGLATAANRLRGLPGPSRVIVLLSDGENNRGTTDPRDAARAAAAFGIRVYTVGVGSRGVARVPVARVGSGLRYARLPVTLDEPLLREIASTTSGRYFRATDRQALARVWGEIDRLERAPTEVRRYVRFTDHHLPLLLAAAALLLLEWSLRGSRWGAVP